ncbi:hypothetical protein V5N11_027276 [Cardamine amara subsp. amara]|uniref:Reverse transcriptase n=1 Tax=Cardamine amara subsp. amara TaxID=228776 RepID=A0ABD1AIW1_CARAN
MNENGVERFEDGSKGDIAVKYFQKLFTATNTRHYDELLTGLLPRVSSDMNRRLTAIVTREEIRRPAFDIDGSSAPGADGMTGTFYQKYWSVVGD